ncbi:hypothetical protein SNK03_011645 [Fusarium graminearum]|uniref:Chromosome 3, complete genome n=2 Tax=Gibberella zeae TaxID=5518 RepID=I1S7F6_GIBZE|nr:hypothetical protein FGSG_12779 [Fusarium graminearum PH-1]EYB29664.1 hypothetical protein FG05_12779 [Fusarium graminearum]ESU11660.1 hypothetical protein FGSG_12779 [Fusarium graminearum PH-1]CAF3463143.1 unnamed protein product [Fusarium graminearum]CAF3534030.1 unnamed protein product [Fusarium graminearum]CAG1961271.1 unnamed protein product [Fusarium graminearum]|eukprot:XP_011324236.1 hypothetical protein FGSG_12779 [Fusarium graminearum PH-1]
MSNQNIFDRFFVNPVGSFLVQHWRILLVIFLCLATVVVVASYTLCKKAEPQGRWRNDFQMVFYMSALSAFSKDHGGLWYQKKGATGSIRDETSRPAYDI